MSKLLGLFLIGFVFMSCVTQQNKEQNDKAVDFWVNSQLGDCSGVGHMKCMQVQESDSIIEGQWENFYSEIEGFDYEEGYVYHLRVKKEELDSSAIPADASSIKYSLIELISKDKIENSISGKWRLNSINMKALSIVDEKKVPNMEVDVKAHKISGVNGCNRFHMSFELLDNNGIKFGPVASSRKLCPDPNYEKDFMEAINTVVKYSLSDKRLVFFNKDGVEVLNFSRI